MLIVFDESVGGVGRVCRGRRRPKGGVLAGEIGALGVEVGKETGVGAESLRRGGVRCNEIDG